MKILIIGSGLIGLTSAYYLRGHGHEVCVIDRREGPGRETSFANGALLTPSMAEPWNSPGCWRVLLASVARSDASLQVRASALPSLIGWGARFLKNSSSQRFHANTIRNVRLALFSLEVLEDLRHEMGIEYGAAARGTLKLFRSDVALDVASAAADRLVAEGLKHHRLSRQQAVALEPALGSVGDQLIGAIHYEADQMGDAYRFCLALTELARQRGVHFSFGTTVSGLTCKSGRVMGVQTDRESFTADQYVIAAGSYSTRLLQPLGFDLQVRPAKGYSVTFDVHRGASTPKIPIVDDEMHAAIVPIGDAIRAAGTAEFSGYDLTLRPERVHNVVSLAQRILPTAGLDPSAARFWCGLRPMSADGVPLIGRTRIANLWVNTGHGHLGWTMAAGSGQLLADLISEVSPAVASSPYDPGRFG